MNGHPWRQALSTTHTFGARVKTFVENKPMLEYATKFGGAYDHAGCLMYQGFSPYSFQFLKATFVNGDASAGWLRRSAVLGWRTWLNLYSVVRVRNGARARILVAPDPALITHLETGCVAAGTDWCLVAQRTEEWMAGSPKPSSLQPLA